MIILSINMKIKKILCVLLFIFVAIFGLQKLNFVNAAASDNAAPPISYLEESNSGDDFYTIANYDVTGLSGDSLANKLADLMEYKHRYFTSYGQLRYSALYSDGDPEIEGNIILLYSGASIVKDWGNGTVWNREHVWCKNLSGGLYASIDNSGKGAGADVHALKPADDSINSSRSNHPFSDEGNRTSEAIYKATGAKTGSYLANLNGQTVWEPRDAVKGDIARILMYLYVHYSLEISANSSFSYAGNLDIGNICATKAGTDESIWEMLLDWNELDPVDDFERTRNAYCTSVTGTRNPFIDHPEFADMIWDDDYQGAGALIGGSTDYLTVTPASIELEVGDTYQINTTTNLQSSITYTSSDPSLLTVSSSGVVEAISSGEVEVIVSCGALSKKVKINITNNVSFGGWNLVTDVEDLEDGDEILFANLANHVVSSAYGDNTYFTSVSATFASDNSSLIPNDGYQSFILEKNDDAWKIKINGKYLTTNAAKKLLVDGSGSYDSWTININSNTAVIASTNDLCGNIQYNTSAQIPRFLNYTSSQLPISIYKYEVEEPDLESLEDIGLYASLGYCYSGGYSIKKDYHLLNGADQLVDGAKIILVSKINSKYYAMGNSVSSNKISAHEVDCNNKLISNYNEEDIYEIKKTELGYQLLNVKTNKYLIYSDSTDINLSDSGTNFSFDATMGFVTSSRPLLGRYFNGNYIYGAYAASNYNMKDYASEILVYVEEDFLSDDFSSSEFRIRFGVDNLINEIEDFDEIGIQISTDTKTVKAKLDNLHLDNDMYYYLVSLGDALNNKDRLVDEFNLKIYAIKNGNTYYSLNNKTYSIVQMINQYHSLEIAQVSELYNYFTLVGYYDEK